MLLIKAKTRRKKIAEGQTVTYKINNKLVKYKKVSGVMKYVGVASAAVKTKKEPEKKVSVAKVSKEQTALYKETGIMCKDKNALDYVNGEMKAMFKQKEINIDYEKVPRYIKWIYHPNTGSSSKYTTNKIGIKLDEIIEMEKKYDVKMFTGMPKEVKDIIEPYRKIMVKQYAATEKKRKIKKEKKNLESAHNRSINEVWGIKNELYDKYNVIARNTFIGRHGNITIANMTDDQFNEMQSMIPNVLSSHGGAETISAWGGVQENILKVKKDKDITALEKKKLIDALKTQIEPLNELEKYKKDHAKDLAGTGNFELHKKIKKDITKAQKDNPKSKNWFEALYIAYYTNKLLLPKTKANPQLINAQEAYGITTNEELRALFIKKRSKGYKTKGAQEKMLGSLSEKGDEKLTFALNTVSAKEKKIVYNKMLSTFDKDEHDDFGYKVHNVFKIDDTSYYKDYKKIEKEIGNVKFSYHGTAFNNAAKIARSGFKVTKPETGRMIGDGIYGAKSSSKSLQYIGRGWTHRIGSRGVLFVCKNALGVIKHLNDNEINRQFCNGFFKYDKFDTTYASKGTGGLRNDEWCCKNPKQFMPIYWIDVELAKPGVYE